MDAANERNLEAKHFSAYDGKIGNTTAPLNQ
jgi:hypothetical protein